MATFKNPAKIDELFNHMKSVHNIIPVTKLRWNQTAILKFSPTQLSLVTGADRIAQKCSPIFDQVVDLKQQTLSRREIFVLMFKLEEDSHNEVLFSLACAMLTSEIGEVNPNIRIRMLIKAQNNSRMSSTWYNECVPDLMYSFKPMSAPNIKEFLDLPVVDRSSIPLTLTVSQINKYYVNKKGNFTIEYSFHKE